MALVFGIQYGFNMDSIRTQHEHNRISIWIVDSRWIPHGLNTDSVFRVLYGFRVGVMLVQCGLEMDPIWIQYGLNTWDSIWFQYGFDVFDEDSIWIQCGLNMDLIRF